MDAAGSFVIQATTYQTTWHYNPEEQSKSWVQWEDQCQSCTWIPGGLDVQYSNSDNFEFSPWSYLSAHGSAKRL